MKFDISPLTSKMHIIDPRYYASLLTETESEDFYKDFITEEFILRDHLAIDRTMLSNETTFLSYIRTALAIGAAGGTLIHFAGSTHAYLIGAGLLAGGFVVFFVGVARYRKMKKIIHAIRTHHKTTSI